MTSRVFVIVASGADAAAMNFVAIAAGSGMRWMSPADLSQPGWKFRLRNAVDSVAVVAGRPIATARIAGVITRLPIVNEYDLAHIVESDRRYVAAEMTAFLLAWLTSLKCPLLNRPTPQCLSGPCWRQEKWVLTANRLAIPSRAVVRRARFSSDGAGAAGPEPAGNIITIVGRNHVGAGSEVLVKRAHALAQAARVDLLSVQFDGQGPDAKFVDANLWPDLGDARIAEAVIDLLRKRATPRNPRRKTDDIAVGNFAG
jgi:hypothetical protein